MSCRIVSREFHIPCIVNIKNLTKKLHTGDIISIDFNNGKIIVKNRFKL